MRTSPAALVIASVVSTALLASSCAPLEGPLDVEVLLPDEGSDAGFRLGTVTLHSVTDLLRGKGKRFDVRAGLNVNAFTLIDELREEQLSFEELVRRSRESSGDDMQPRLYWDGGRYVAEDYDSLQYLTIFHNFERAWDFAAAVGDTSTATSDRSLVGFYSSVSLNDALPVPLQTSDNAAYVTFIDAWMTFRMFLVQEGVPFSMNPGVIAHELHHRVFFHNVFRGEAYESWRAWVTSDEFTRAGNLMKGLDEGLADLFAVGMTRDLAFMSHSLKGAFEGEAAFRDLEGELAGVVTYDDLSSSLLPQGVQEHCGFATEVGQDLYALPAFQFYCAGTLVARALFEGAGEDFDALVDDVLPAVNRSLPLVGARVAAESSSGQLSFDLDVFLDALVTSLPEERRQRMCSALEPRFESFFAEDRVPSCAP